MCSEVSSTRSLITPDFIPVVEDIPPKSTKGSCWSQCFIKINIQGKYNLIIGGLNWRQSEYHDVFEMWGFFFHEEERRKKPSVEKLLLRQGECLYYWDTLRIFFIDY